MADSSHNEKDLFERLAEYGLGGLVDDQSIELADLLEEAAARSGESAPLFLAEAIKAVGELRLHHDKYGGIRISFLESLDALVKKELPKIQVSHASSAGRLAMGLRDKICDMVNRYDPS
jgi:hypothetical protein